MWRLALKLQSSLCWQWVIFDMGKLCPASLCVDHILFPRIWQWDIFWVRYRQCQLYKINFVHRTQHSALYCSLCMLVPPLAASRMSMNIIYMRPCVPLICANDKLVLCSVLFLSLSASVYFSVYVCFSSYPPIGQVLPSQGIKRDGCYQSLLGSYVYLQEAPGSNPCFPNTATRVY